MTTEEKAKAYDEAIKKAKEIKEKIVYSHLSTESCKAVSEYIDTIIPELAESEDERILNGLIAAIKDQISCGGEFYFGIPLKDILAYLEKQKNQKPNVEYVYPKFRVGDEIVEVSPNGSCPPVIIKYIGKGNYNCESKDRKRFLSFPIKQENEYRLIEQQPAECLKAEKDGWYVCIKDFYAGGKKQCSVGDLVQAKGGMYMLGKEDISEWFRRAYYEDVRDAFGPNTDTNIPEQKPAEWSNEDEKMLTGIIERGSSQVPFGEPALRGEQMEWLMNMLKSHRLQPKQEWSEEEKQKLNRIYEILGYAADDKGFLTSKRIIGDKEAIELQDFLKSLHPSWKPSEEQMAALERTIRLANFGAEENRRKALESLHDQLQKLKGGCCSYEEN